MTSPLPKKRCMVSFRIFGQELDPAQVSRLLDINPDHVHLQGEDRHNDPKYTPFKDGMWLLDSMLSDEESLDSHLRYFLSLLETKQEQIRVLQKNNTVDFYCSLIDQHGVHLPADLLGRISRLGANIEIDMYPP